MNIRTSVPKLETHGYEFDIHILKKNRFEERRSEFCDEQKDHVSFLIKGNNNTHKIITVSRDLQSVDDTLLKKGYIENHNGIYFFSNQAIKDGGYTVLKREELANIYTILSPLDENAGTHKARQEFKDIIGVPYTGIVINGKHLFQGSNIPLVYQKDYSYDDKGLVYDLISNTYNYNKEEIPFKDCLVPLIKIKKTP